MSDQSSTTQKVSEKGEQRFAPTINGTAFQTHSQHSARSTQHYQHIYISPHFDDVPLSCGGQVAAQTRAGEPALVVTVCSRVPTNKVKRTPFAAQMEAEWRVTIAANGPNIYLTRRIEEENALRRLGAEHEWLDYLDAIYRGKAYNSDAALFGKLLPADLKRVLPWLTSDFAKIAAPHRQATLYFPLAVGNHVDHQLAHIAGRELAARGYHVLFYEDFPYASRSDALAERVAQIPDQLLPTLTDISATLDDKIAAIAAYGSQLGVLFGGAAAMRDQVRSYATHVAHGDGLAERYWRIV